MPRQVTLISVLIASPSDVSDEREALQETMHKWNSLHSASMKIFLEPVLWESHATPEMGERPQAIINKQIVDSSDVLIGIFWTRIGTKTGKAVSGSVEEIERFIKSKKPTLLYFSNRPKNPSEISPTQYRALKDFKAACRKRGIHGEFNSVNELKENVFNHLTRLATKIQRLVESPPGAIPEAMVKYLNDFPNLKLDYDIQLGRVKTTRDTLFKAVKYIYDSIPRGSKVTCTDHLNFDKEVFRRYWATEGLNHLRNNHEASGRGIKIKRLFIFCERDIKEYDALLRKLCRLHKLAGVEPMVAKYEDLPKECLYEFALFENLFLDEARYDFRSEWIIENYIHWSPHMLASFQEKSNLIETYCEGGWAKQYHRAKDFRRVIEFASEYLKYV
jgi:hypothetical protein